MYSNLGLAIIILLVIIVNALWFAAKFFIRKNGPDSYSFFNHFQDFVWLYRLASKEYPANVNIKAKSYLIAIPLLIVATIACVAMPTIASLNSYSQKYNFNGTWLKEQIDEERARSIIEANIEDATRGDWIIVHFDGEAIGRSKYDANSVWYADAWDSNNYEDNSADFFGKVGTKDELWTFEIDQDSHKHVAYIDGIVLVQDGEPAIAIGLTRNDRIPIPKGR